MMHIEYSVLVCKKSTLIQPITSPVEFVARALHFTWIPTIHYLDSQLPIFSCLSDFLVASLPHPRIDVFLGLGVIFRDWSRKQNRSARARIGLP